MFYKLKNRPEKNYFHRPQKNANLTDWQSGRTAQKNGAYTGPAERRRAKAPRQTAKTERGVIEPKRPPLTWHLQTWSSVWAVQADCIVSCGRLTGDALIVCTVIPIGGE